MSKRDPQHGGGWGGSYTSALPLALFDRLPWAIRRLYCYAAYDYSAAKGWRMHLNGRPVPLIVEQLLRAMKRALRREAGRLYGPDHPQARP